MKAANIYAAQIQEKDVIELGGTEYYVWEILSPKDKTQLQFTLVNREAYDNDLPALPIELRLEAVSGPFFVKRNF